MFPVLQPVLLGGYCSQAQQFFARAPEVHGKRKRLYDKMIRKLVASGVWSQLDVFYILAAPSSTVALTNLISSSFTAVANGSPTFTADQGYTGTDASSTVYLATNFNPSTAGGKYAQNSAHISAWSNTTTAAGASGGNDIGLASAGGGSTINCKYSSGSAFWLINDNVGAAGVAVADARGFYVSNRSASGAQQGYKNAVDQSVVSGTSAALLNGGYVILAENKIGTGVTAGSGRQIMAASIGGSLTAAQVTAYYNALHAHLVSVAGITY